MSGSGEQIADDVIDGGTNDAGVNIDTTAGAVTAEFDFDNITSVTTFGTTAGNAANISFSEITETTSQTITYTGGTGALTIDNNAASSTTKFSITGGDAIDFLEGSSGADTLTGGSASDTAADTQSGGAGVDKFVYGAAAALFSGTAIIDSLNGGDGSVGVISTNGGAATTIANTVLYGRVTSVEEFAVLATDQNVSITLPDDSGFNKIDFSADTTTAGTNVINVSAEDTAGFTLLAGTAGIAITGSAVADNITGGAGDDTLTAGAGNDVIATGNGDNVVVAGDGDDSITGGTGTDVITVEEVMMPSTFPPVVMTQLNSLLLEELMQLRD